MESVHVTRVAPAAAVARMDELLRVYAAAFAGPPWHEDPAEIETKRGPAIDQLGRVGAEAALATRDEDVVGAAWGWGPGHEPPRDDLHGRLRAAAGEADAAAYLDGAAFVLVELMVDPAAHGHGIGARLVTELLGGRPAWLLTHPDGDALSFYLKRGWRDAAALQASDGVPLRWLVRPAAG